MVLLVEGDATLGDGCEVCNLRFSYELSSASLKLFVGFSIFDSVPFLLKFIFLFIKMHGLSGSEMSLFLSK